MIIGKRNIKINENISDVLIKFGVLDELLIKLNLP